MFRDAGGRLLRVREAALHHVRIGEEVQVVGVIHHPVQRIRRRGDEVAAIGCRAGRVCCGRCGVITGTGVDVRWHVEEMPGRFGDLVQPVCACQRSSRRPRGFHRMNVVVIGAEVLWIPEQDTFDGADDLFGARRRLVVERPQFPRRQVHQTLGVNHRRIESSGYRRDSTPIAWLKARASAGRSAFGSDE